jgi:phosphate transport system substrate-binding protein
MMTKAIKFLGTLIICAVAMTGIHAQSTSQTIVVSGELMAETLVNEWAKDFEKAYPGVIVKFVPNAPNADLIVDFANTQDKKWSSEYFPIGRTVLVPVANSQSSIATAFGEKGLTKEEIKTMYFDDPFADEQKSIKDLAYQVYSRLGDSGIPAIFATAYGYSATQIKGKAIAGNDFHVIKAISKDTEAVSFTALNLVYDLTTRKVKDNLVVIPVDINGNGRITSDEKFYQTLDNVLSSLQLAENQANNTIPLATLRISSKTSAQHTPSLDFVKWILADGQNSLTRLGFLPADTDLLEKALVKLDRLAVNHQQP